MNNQRQRARSARGESSYMGSDENPINKIDLQLILNLYGYFETEIEAKVVALADDKEMKNELVEGEKGYIVTDSTTFYAEMGGQVGDRGIIISESGEAYVYNTKKNIGGKIIHYVEVKSGTIKKGEKVYFKSR